MGIALKSILICKTCLRTRKHVISLISFLNPNFSFIGTHQNCYKTPLIKCFLLSQLIVLQNSQTQDESESKHFSYRCHIPFALLQIAGDHYNTQHKALQRYLGKHEEEKQYKCFSAIHQLTQLDYFPYCVTKQCQCII